MTRGINITEPTITPHVVDRSGWDNGPWDNEPDRIEWRHHGVPCLLVRSTLGNWCGYAAVAPGHPLYEKDYSGCAQTPACDTERYCGHSPDGFVDVHGGLTYSGACEGHICHVAQPGEPDPVWWFGFDCGHAGDVSPGMIATMRQFARSSFAAHGTYKDAAYTRAEVERLADQLLALR